MGFGNVVYTYGYPLISKEVAEAIYYARRIRYGDMNTTDGIKTTIRKRQELLGLRIVSVLNGETGTMDDAKSMFNKEKWLPAAQELPFAISHYCCMIMKKNQ